MADIAPKASTADGKTTKVAKADAPTAAPTTKPERPDEEEYKTNLAKAEKELKAAEEKMVSWYRCFIWHIRSHGDIIK